MVSYFAVLFDAETSVRAPDGLFRSIDGGARIEHLNREDGTWVDNPDLAGCFRGEPGAEPIDEKRARRIVREWVSKSPSSRRRPWLAGDQMAWRDERTGGEIDRRLERALRVWKELPTVEAESLCWDGEELEVYLADLAVARDEVERLREHRRGGAMTPEQELRHDELERVFNANLIRTRRLREDVEWELRRALRAWESLPEVGTQIEGWDEVERLNFVHEWPLQEMRLDRLRSHEREGVMTEEQLERFRELGAVVERNRPIIEAILDRYIGQNPQSPGPTA